MRALKGKRISKLLPWAVFLGLLLIWEGCVRIFSVPLYVLPAPSKVLTALISDRAAIFQHALITVTEAASGMLIALVLALALGIVMDAFPTVRKSLYPILVVTQTIPMIVLAPILIIYLGFGMAPKILTVVLMCFFPIVVNFSDGMAHMDPCYENLVRSYGAKRMQVYTLAKIPAAMSSLLSGLRVAATYSITGAVVGEWIGSQSGLGYYLLRLRNGYMLDRVFACVVMIVILSLLMNGAIRLCQYCALPYMRKRRTGI